MKSAKRKDFSTVFGEVKIVEGKKRFIPKSSGHMNAVISRLPFNINIACTFSAAVATRSDSQLNYHWVLMEYMSEHSGHTKEECHDFMMRKVFGTKKIRIGNIIQEVRLSISEKALFPKTEMVELIDQDLQLLKELNVNVPTMSELGYISNNDQIKIK